MASNGHRLRLALTIRVEILLFLEGVSGASNGSDRIEAAAPFQGLPQSSNMHVDCAFTRVYVVAPDAATNLLSRKHVSGTRHQELEEPEFGDAEVDLAARPKYPTRVAIQFDITNAKQAA